ncbi:MAG: peptidase U32 [Desulfuromonadales bacterium GWD2_61_12]|nr:MAG: peptidase U32 [Desulfuromonadales bacterium GWC2_61_20]OGR36204.1 MAG: peptidase U32 [Desulfuromonadales bacterium GWD2_61_12]HBT84076.1 peptidase U32 [Desulfuromonas sp.]
MSRPELLAPAGDVEKLRTALAYGADAVYAGGERFSLRAMAGNLTTADLRQGLELVRAAGKRFYLTLNAYLRPDEIPLLENYLEELRPLAIDAYIVADPGVVATIRRVDPGRALHLSTQANTTNAAAVNFWAGQGVRRVNLARELNLAELGALRTGTASELEVFVHGAVCVAVSGRCLLSAALTGRSANRGACTHPCRWPYALIEESRPGAFFPIAEDKRGSYLMNSRDLCLVEHLPAILGAGVDSLKIEGRMKSVYYVAAVTRVYRAALDAWLVDPAGWHCDPLWRSELEKVSHRPYDHGFLLGGAPPQTEAAQGGYRRSHDFVGVVTAVRDDGRGEVVARNPFISGEALELIGPAMRSASFKVGAIVASDARLLDRVNPNAHVSLSLPPGARAGDLLRREGRLGTGTAGGASGGS